MIKAIVYTSYTGTTAAYAKLLSEETGLPAYTVSEAKTAVAAGSEIIYLGWLMASGVKGYKDAAARYAVSALCGVGMGASGSQCDDVRKRNAVPETTPVFTAQGGFHMEKLRGVYRLMMGVMKRTAGKSLAAKKDRTKDEDDMLDLLQNGGDRVDAVNLQPLVAWYRALV